jgi:hypothetical protein
MRGSAYCGCLPSDKPEETEWPGDLNIDIVRVLLWIAVIAGVGVLAYFAYDVLPTFGLAGRTRWDDHADGAGISESGVNEATRLAADELAAPAQYVDWHHDVRTRASCAAPGGS